MTVDAVLVIGIGGYVIVEFTDADAVIVTAGAAADDAGMIIAARAESTRGMTDLAIVRTDGHVCIERCAERYTRRIDTVVTVVAALRQNRWIGVIDSKCRDEALGVVAGAAVGRSRRVRRHGRGLAGCGHLVGPPGRSGGSTSGSAQMRRPGWGA